MVVKAAVVLKSSTTHFTRRATNRKSPKRDDNTSLASMCDFLLVFRSETELGQTDRVQCDFLLVFCST